MPGNDPYKGHAAQIAVGVEETQGTSVTPTQHFAQIEEETDHPDPENNFYEERVIGGDRELYDKSLGQVAYAGGSYPTVVVDALPLVWAFGEESYSSPTHTITAAGVGSSSKERPPSLTVEATQYGRGGGPDFIRTFSGVVCESGTLSIDNDSRLTFEADAIALGVDPETASDTDVGGLSAGNPWVYSDISSNLTINGTAFARVSDFSLDIDNQPASRYYVTSDSGADPFEILYGNVAYDLSATVTADDKTLYNEVVNQNLDIDVSLAFTRGNGDTLNISVSGVGLTESPYSTPRGDSGEDEIIEVETTGTPESVTITVDDSERSQAVLPSNQTV